MIFGNETPFHLKPIPNRGMRKHEAEVVQHYPGYQSPMAPNPDARNPAYMSEAHRLHPALTVNDELKHERETKRQREALYVESRRARQLHREDVLREAREEEFQRQQAQAAARVGDNRKNEECDHRDTVTHQCYNVESQQRKDFRDAAGKHQYHARQRVVERNMNSTGYNILTWEPRPAIQVPPKPTPPTNLWNGQS